MYQHDSTNTSQSAFRSINELCKYLLASPTHCFHFKQPEILGSICQNKYFYFLNPFCYSSHKTYLNVDGSSILLPFFNTYNDLYHIYNTNAFQTTLSLFCLSGLFRFFCQRINWTFEKFHAFCNCDFTVHSKTLQQIYESFTFCLIQRGPNTSTRAACGPRTVFVRPANASVCRILH